MKRLIALAVTTGLAAIVSAPATAQDEAGDRVNTVIIYGDDECPESTDDTITVCARMDESERYRIPPNLRQSDDPANDSWTARVRSFEQVGRFGQQSCTPVGAGGDLGCTIQMIENAYADRAEGQDIRFSQLIEEARADRLSEIDAEAAATQRRVEELEESYMRQLESERDAPLPGEEEAMPQVVDPDEIPERPATN